MAGGAPLVVWLLQDGKAGHQNQALALVEALQRLILLSVQVLAAPARACPGLGVLRAWHRSQGLARPGLVVGAGHATHGALLALMLLKRVPGLVVMRPSLPLAWFSRVVAPSHDLATAVASPRLIPTFGPLCRQAPAKDACLPIPQPWPRTLVMLGGPSRHHLFDRTALQAHLATLLAADSHPEGWCLVDSRRTPTEALQYLASSLGLTPRQQMSWRNCPSGWLVTALSQHPVVWVSEDSMSMLFEAVSAGCRVGVLPMPRRAGRFRLQHSLERLVAEGYVLPLSAWRPGQQLPNPLQPLDEAGRVADLLVPWLRSLNKERCRR